MNKTRDRETPAMVLPRRQALALTGISLASLALGSFQPAFAQEAPVSGEQEAFMSLSRFVTGHAQIDPLIGSLLQQGLSEKITNFSSVVTRLHAAIDQGHHSDVESLEGALRGDPLHDVLLTIVKAWYAGIIEDGTQAKVYAFENALMYQPARDVVVIPTYAHNGPNYWTAEPNAVDAMPEF